MTFELLVNSSKRTNTEVSMDANSENFAMCLELFPSKMTRQQFDHFFSMVFQGFNSTDSFWKVYQENEDWLDSVEAFQGIRVNL
jgi:hypothetical protein